jgi:hypothetical protein
LPQVIPPHEWYDFFIYATSAGLVFAQPFFQPAGKEIALLLSFATAGIPFLFRPLGALPTYSHVSITPPILLLLPPYRAGSLGRWRARRGGPDGR